MENITAEILQNGEYKIIELVGKKLLVFKSGTIYRWYENNGRKIKNPYWKLVQNTNTGDGYNTIKFDKTSFRRHRIMAFAYLNLDINNPEQHVDHINGDRLNNHVDNLRLVNQHENNLNNTKAKGYYYCNARNKFNAQIKHKDKRIHLGYFTTEEDARQAYLNAKAIYHIIPDRKNNNN